MIKLDKFTEQDFQRLINWIKSKDDLVLFAGPVFQFPLDNSQLSDYIKSDSRLVYKVVDSISENVIGHCELNDINHSKKSARVCRMLIGEESYRNKGYGKAALKKLISIAFKELSLNTLTLKVYENNLGAVKCYKNCGFEIKGKIHKSFIGENAYWASYIMGLTNIL
jgi:RimJ/RimL family protein N-acetyltransferase